MGKRYIAGLVLAAAVCLFVFFPGQSVYAADVNPTGVNTYEQYFYLYPGNVTSTSASDVYSFLSVTIGNVEPVTEYQRAGEDVRPTYKRTATYYFSIWNRKDYPVLINASAIRITLAPKFSEVTLGSYSYKWVLADFETITGELEVFRFSGNTAYIRNSPEYNLQSKIYIPANSSVQCVFKVEYTWNYGYPSPGSLNGFNASWSYPTLPISYIDASDIYPSYESYLMAVAEAMADQVQASEDLDGQTSDTTSDLDSQHQQEQSYFEQSSDAIDDIGFDTWSFDNFQGDGMSYASQLFGRVWTALGPFTYIIVFILLMKFGTMVLRHRGSGGE